MVRGKANAAAAVAQAQRISNKESLELVKCLLRVSIYHVSFLRGFFPDEKFHGVDMNNLDGMHVKMLKPCCDESKRLVDWVEKGVADALEKRYIKNMFFGISKDREGAQLLEEYVFSFNYSEDGVDMEVAAGNKSFKKKSSFPAKGKDSDVNSVRYQVIRLMRMLVQICQTLDQVPAERYIFMKLTYHDNTPEDYEPPCFLPLADNSIGHFDRKPFSMHMGTVDTDHHVVALRIKSVLDACNDPDDMQPDHEGAGSQQVSDLMDAEEADDPADSVPSLSAGAADAMDSQEGADQQHQGEADAAAADQGSPADDGHAMERDPAYDAGTEMTEASEGAAAAAGMEDAEVLSTQQQLHAYCLQRSQVVFTDAMVNFMDVSPKMLEGFFDNLVAEGVLEVGSMPDVYHVCGAAPAVGQHSNDLEAMDQDHVDDVMTSKLSGLSVGVGRMAASAAHGAGQGMHDHMRQVAVDASVAAQVQTTHAGSAMTLPQQHLPAEQPMPGTSSGSAGASVQAKEVQHVYFDASQQSLMPGKKGVEASKRKASFVTQPIHQTQNKGIKKKPLTAGKVQRNRLSGMK